MGYVLQFGEMTQKRIHCSFVLITVQMYCFVYCLHDNEIQNCKIMLNYMRIKINKYIYIVMVQLSEDLI